jgi:hypothetical protein
MKNKRTYTLLRGLFFAAALILAGCPQPTDSDEEPSPQPPGAPLNVRLIAAERQLTVTWEKAEGAENYELYYGSAEATSGGAERPGAVGENVTRHGSTTALITSLTNDTSYYVWVKAINREGETWSEPASATPQTAVTPPEAPRNVQLTGLDKELLVSWDSADGATSYEVYLGTVSDFAAAVKKTESAGLSWLITGLENGAEYTVWVRAVNSAGPSPLSATVQGEPAEAPIFDDIEDLAAYFAEKAGNTAAVPYAVALNGFDLSSDLTQGNDPLGKVYAAVGGKYFSLDLSGCNGDLGAGTITGTAPANKDRLVSCVLPESLESIGNFAFYNCTALASISLPESLTSIGTYTFQYCISLASISLPESLQSIGNSAFQYCPSLASISLPESLQSIGTYAFSGCTALASLSIAEGLKSI